MSPDPTLAMPLAGATIKRRWSNDAWRHGRPDIIVAIPARNEAALIGRCLSSLCTQQPARRAFGVVVLINETTDATFHEVVMHGRRHTLPLLAIEATLPPQRRDAGAARCIAMQIARQHLDAANGSIFTTDADSVVPASWIRGYEALMDAGYDAVAGSTLLHERDAADLPHSLRQREQLERRYASCLDALECWLDPEPHNPWPRHYHASGASIALSATAMDALAHATWPACGEDRHMIRFLQEQGLRVRHDLSHKVWTSGRLFGRARGGMADTLRQRILSPDAACDERLETVDRLWFRASTRRMFRELHQRHDRFNHDLHALAARLALPHQSLVDALLTSAFAAGWASVERHSPRLRREPLNPGQLARECARGETWLAQLGLPTDVAQPQAATS